MFPQRNRTTIGHLDRQITLQQPAVARDSSTGAEVITWADVATVWAQRTEKMAAEAVVAEQRVMTRSITYRIRYRADVLSTWRVKEAARLMRIDGTIEIGRHEFTDLMCEETSDV